jgi:hypothetical protein
MHSHHERELQFHRQPSLSPPLADHDGSNIQKPKLVRRSYMQPHVSTRKQTTNLADARTVLQYLQPESCISVSLVFCPPIFFVSVLFFFFFLFSFLTNHTNTRHIFKYVAFEEDLERSIHVYFGELETH